jgi:hypothetical protein
LRVIKLIASSENSFKISISQNVIKWKGKGMEKGDKLLYSRDWTIKWTSNYKRPSNLVILTLILGTSSFNGHVSLLWPFQWYEESSRFKLFGKGKNL